MNSKSLLTIISVIVIFAILIYSVVLGYTRRVQSQQNKKIETAREIITQKLDQADEVAFINMGRAVILVSEAKSELDKLKKELGNKPNKQVDELQAMIQQRENKIVKKEDKTYEEFFDLTVENKNATGVKLFLNEDTASILDNKNAKIYILSLPKKSLDSYSSNSIQGSTLIAFNGDSAFYYKPNDGIYTINNNNPKKVINNDKDWKNIGDMQMYNGNIYLLDKGSDDIYKYIAADNGFSDKNSYFKSGKPSDLNNATSFAIDLSVYIALNDRIIKYTAGAQDGFKTVFPVDNVSITKVVTNANLDKVYAWDKRNGAIYILGKSGEYDKQVKSSILTRADDVVVFENAAYILSGPKIYKMSLE